MRLPILLPALVSLSLGAQGLVDRLKTERITWEQALDRGEGQAARKGTEALLNREGLAVNPSDYNGMHALVALRNMAARACVAEGAWEDALEHLKKAAQAADQNAATAEVTLGQLKRQHVDKITEWKEAVAKQSGRLKALEEGVGLTVEDAKLRQQLKTFLEEHRQAIAHSEWSIQAIAEIQTTLASEKANSAKYAAEWEKYLAHEKADRAFESQIYVADKLEQLKADDAKPKPERLAYANRLAKLDPANADVKRFIAKLTGAEVEAKPEPKAASKKKGKSRRKK